MKTNIDLAIVDKNNVDSVIKNQSNFIVSFKESILPLVIVHELNYGKLDLHNLKVLASMQNKDFDEVVNFRDFVSIKII